MANIVILDEYLAKLEKTQNIADVEKYEQVLMRSIIDFHTYSVSQKQQLFESVALFNISLLNNLLKKKYGMEGAE